jgi:hypothetical protein
MERLTNRKWDREVEIAGNILRWRLKEVGNI